MLIHSYICFCTFNLFYSPFIVDLGDKQTVSSYKKCKRLGYNVLLNRYFKECADQTSKQYFPNHTQILHFEQTGFYQIPRGQFVRHFLT